jgi:hypothetical protein
MIMSIPGPMPLLTRPRIRGGAALDRVTGADHAVHRLDGREGGRAIGTGSGGRPAREGDERTRHDRRYENARGQA